MDNFYLLKETNNKFFRLRRHFVINIIVVVAVCTNATIAFGWQRADIVIVATSVATVSENRNRRDRRS